MDLMEKLISYPEGPKLSKSLEAIKECCSKIWKHPLLQWFTNHDIGHSEEIIYLLGQILEPLEGRNSDEGRISGFLNEHELFILLASAYLHDIGMQCLKVDDISIENLTQDEYDKIRKRHAEKSYEIILKGVAEKLDRDDFHLPHIDEEYIPIIAKVSKGHATGCFEEVINKFQDEQYVKNRPVRGQLLTSLLMIGDELDLACKRVDLSKIAQFKLSVCSQVHWYKHYYVESIKVENGIIHLILKFPKESDDYQPLFQELIERKLREQIEKVNLILREFSSGRLSLNEKPDIKIRNDETPTKRILPEDVLRELRKVLGKDKPKAIVAEDSNEEGMPNFPKPSYPKPSPIFTGREEELGRFKGTLDTSSIISIEGLGGIGKTEFAAKCIEKFIPNKAKVVWFECFQDSKLDALIDLSGFSDVIKGESKTELAKYSGFTDLIEREGKCIFLDNYQEIMDDSFGKFLQFSARRLQKAKIILIAREHPVIGEVRVVPIELLGLEDDSVEYAKKIIEYSYPAVRANDSDLISICDNLDGHPLAIELAIQLFRYGESSQDIIRKVINLKGRGEELTRRLLDEVFNHPRSTDQEKRFMLYFSIFRGRVEKNAIHAVLEFEDSTLHSLIDKHMIISSGGGLYSTHPLIRECCYQRLEGKEEIHLKAAKYFKTNRKEKFDPLLEEEIFYHLLRSGCFQKLADLISEKGDKFICSGHTNSLKEKINITISKEIVRPEFFIFYGDIAQIQGDWQDASYNFDKAFSFHGVDERISAEAYIKFGEMLYRRGEVKESLSYFKDSYNICKNRYRKEEARSLNDIGLVYQILGDLTHAEDKINKAIRIYKEIGNEELFANSLNNIGNILTTKGDFEGALNKHNESLTIRQKIGDKEGIAGSLNGIGIILKTKGDLKGALDKYNESLAIQQEIGNKEGIAYSLEGIGGIFESRGDKGDLEKALDKCNKSLTIQQEIGSKGGIAHSLISIANISYDKGDFKGALSKYNESLAIEQEIGNKQGIAASFNNIGNILKFKGDFEGALSKYNESLAIRQEIGDKQGIAGSYHNLGALSKEEKKYALSLQHFLKSYALSNQMGIKKQKTLGYIFGIRKTLGLLKFKELMENAFNTLTEDLKPFLNLQEFTEDKTIRFEAPKLGRNDPCPCGSGKKYKKCCGQ